ncbi:TIGR03089 family protein [Plantactinospora endophytica]|uniref:TIGR03089 family protein n=1 Tax=Plantactinospora endophytica TaxID=673535 RepID=A0ABQ4E3Z6_9ACTN|nr:TIGR03089 family protein [Plantactinospora endophytica]GIG89424.1 TIGR03089 family protein [Plantactinospora endophytica]
MTEKIAGLFAAAIAADPTRPLLTWYDDATGDRTELSGATLANWVAKTANLLVDSAGLAPGDSAGVLLPPHWQTAAVLLGCWSTGLSVFGARPDDTDGQPVDVLFAAADRVDEATDWPAGDRYALALAPLAAPVRQLPSGWADYVVEVRGHGDHFRPYPGAGPQDPVLADLAADRAAELGIGAGERVLVDAARHPDPVDWLLAPLAARASVVLCGNLDPARLADRAETEKVTVRLT